MYYYFAAGEYTAATISQNASQAYKALPAAKKMALKEEGVAQREQMTRANKKSQAEKIGKKIQKLVCFQ